MGFLFVCNLVNDNNYSLQKVMLPKRQFEISLIGSVICLIIFSFYHYQLQQEKNAAEKVATDYIYALIQGHSTLASQYVLHDKTLNMSYPLTSVDRFKDAQLLQVIKTQSDSAQHRSPGYQKFYKIMSVMLKIKFPHSDQASNPAGEYIVFINLVKQNPDATWLITELGSGP